MKDDPLTRAKAKAKSAEAKARSALSRVNAEDWEIDTLVERITAIENLPKGKHTEFEVRGPGGIHLRLFGLGGWHLVVAIVAIAGIAIAVWGIIR